MIKLNTLLAKVEHGTSMFNRMITPLSLRINKVCLRVLKRLSNQEMAMQKMLVIWVLLK